MKYTIVILLTRALLKEKKMLSLLNSITRDADFREIFTGLKNEVWKMTSNRFLIETMSIPDSPCYLFNFGRVIASDIFGELGC